MRVARYLRLLGASKIPVPVCTLNLQVLGRYGDDSNLGRLGKEMIINGVRMDRAGSSSFFECTVGREVRPPPGQLQRLPRVTQVVVHLDTYRQAES